MASFLTIKSCSYKTEKLKIESNTHLLSKIINNLDNNFCRNEKESKVTFI